MLVRLLLVATLLVLAACAGGVPGYTPAALRNEQQELVQRPMESGDVGAEGRYG